MIRINGYYKFKGVKCEFKVEFQIVKRLFHVLPGNLIYRLLKVNPNYQRAVVFLAMANGRTISLFVVFSQLPRPLSHELTAETRIPELDMNTPIVA